MRTPANLRTWGQYLQVDIKSQGDSWKVTLKSWPARDRQTLETHAGGRKSIAKFESGLINRLREQGAISL